MPLDLSNWMGPLPKTKKLSEISIAGTHDSGSRYIDPTVHKLRVSPRLTTQTAGIRGQLDAGIRFLDIRVGYTNHRFVLYHEDVSLNLRFGPVRVPGESRAADHAPDGTTRLASASVEAGVKLALHPANTEERPPPWTPR